MQSNAANPEYSSDEYLTRLGIKNWNDRHASLSKPINRNTSLAYDEKGIFVIDHLSLLLTTTYSHPFFKNRYVFQDVDFQNRFILNDHITLVEKSRKDKYYGLEYLIEIDGEQFGHIWFHHFARNHQVKLKVTNSCLYLLSADNIIQRLLCVTNCFDLKYQNIGQVDIAYDTAENLLKNVCELYYQSDVCSSYVHSSHDSKPKYTLKHKRREADVYVDRQDVRYGTYYEGSNRSHTCAKIYCKTYELLSSNKGHIKELHSKCLGTDREVFRAEVTAFSSAFANGKPMHGIDLLDLLLVENRSRLYKKILGRKLVYQSLEVSGYNKSRNPIREQFQIVKVVGEKFKSYSLNQQPKPMEHDQHLNKLKYLLN